MARNKNPDVEIQILRATVCGGKRVEAGDTITASGKDARTLLAMGKAKRLDGEESTEDTTGALSGSLDDADDLTDEENSLLD